MNKQDEKPLAEMLDFLAEGLNYEMTAVRHRFYSSCLSDLDIQDIRAAMNQISRTATFFPKPAEIRAVIEGNPEDRATLAWTTAQKNKNKWISIKFDDLAIHSTIEAMGGWVDFCNMEGYKEEAWQMKDFVKMYKVIGSREAPAYLIGETEIRNSETKWDEFIDPPKQIACNYTGSQKQIEEG